MEGGREEGEGNQDGHIQNEEEKKQKFDIRKAYLIGDDAYTDFVCCLFFCFLFSNA